MNFGVVMGLYEIMRGKGRSFGSAFSHVAKRNERNMYVFVLLSVRIYGDCMIGFNREDLKFSRWIRELKSREIFM